MVQFFPSIIDFEIEHDFPDIGKRIMLLNACRIYLKANRTKLIIITIKDITERKKIEELNEKVRDLDAQLKKNSSEPHWCFKYRMGPWKISKKY